MGYCMTCGETYRSSPGFFECDTCKEKEINKEIFDLSISDFKLLHLIKKNKSLVSEIKIRLKKKTKTN